MFRFLIGGIFCVLAGLGAAAEETKPPPPSSSPPNSALIRDASASLLLQGNAQLDFAAREQLLNQANNDTVIVDARQAEAFVRARIAEQSAQRRDQPFEGFTPAPDAGVGLGVLLTLAGAIVVFAAWWGLGQMLAQRRNRPIREPDERMEADNEPAEPSVAAKRPEVPLTGFARFRVVAGATVGIAIFYALASVLVVVLSIVLVVGLALAVALARFGLWRLATPLIAPHLRLLVLLAQSAWTRNRPEFFVALKPDEAPRLFALVTRLAAAFGVRPPKSIVVEMTASAWIELGGWRARSKSTKLGLGYDLIAGLSEAELEAVIAHEMAHAKFVQRGLKRALNKGVNRAARATNAVAALVQAHRAARVAFDSGETVLMLLRWCTSFSAKRVAAYSRQDEFEADLGAARVCGGAPLRSALQRTQRIHEATARVGWTERLARMQAPGGLGRWLAEILQNHSVQPSGPAHALDDFATHPSDEDRFRVLPDTPAVYPNDAPAMSLLADVDALAKRLITEIQVKALAEERRDTKARAQWLRRIRRKAKVRPLQWLPVFIGAIGVIVVLFTFETRSVWTVVVGSGIVAGAAYGYRLARYRDPALFPVPTLEEIRRGVEGVDDPETREARRKEIEAAIDAQSVGLAREAAHARLRDEAGVALRNAEPLRAFVCYRRLDALKPGQPEAEMIGAVSLAMLKADAAPLLNHMAHTTGLHSTGSLWSAAWALCLMQQPENAEPMLEELTRRHPGEATFVGLLAACEAQRGKIQTAVGHARAAYEHLPSSLPRRELLVDLLVATGRFGEAESLLAEAPIAEHPGLVLSTLRLQLVRGDDAAADHWAAHLKASPQNGHDLLAAGVGFEQARRDAAARDCYAAALAAGFYPAAELGLARLALHQRDYPAVERHALAAINLSQSPAPKAVGPLPLFLTAMTLLNATQPRTRGLHAWLVSAPTDKTLGALQGRTFLVYANAKTKALERVLQVIIAARPTEPPFPAERFKVSFAPQDHQPLGAAHAGIHGVWA